MSKLLPYLCLVLLMVGCSTPLVPEARLPELPRAEMPDRLLLECLRADWQILGRRDVSDKARARAQHRYNDNLLVLLRRMRYDATHDADGQVAGEKHGVQVHHQFMRKELPLHVVYDDMIPAADVELDALKERYTISGLGVPMVGIVPSRKLPRNLKDAFPVATRGTVSSVTAVLQFPKGGPPELLLNLRHRTENIRVGAMQYRLAGDVSAALEVYWDLTRLKDDRMLGLLNPQELRDTTGLSCIETYDPNKIPVILTHGLMSSAGTFDNLVNRLLSHEEIRRNYQFWYFNYPSGVAWTQIARRYRDALAQVRERVDPEHRNPNWERMVVVGHSMGGLITHYSQCEEPWNILKGATGLNQRRLAAYLDAKYVDTPFADVRMESLRRDYFFRPVQAGLVVYMATPHRGAPMARYRIVELFTRMVKLPQTLVQEAINITTLQQDMLLLNPGNALAWFTSVNQLAPDSYSISGLQRLKVRSARTHSIIGDRGEGNSPQSSDGVVPYWSSHIAWGTESIVPADHSVQDVPETAEDMRVLLLDYSRRNPAVHIRRRDGVRW